MLQIFLVNLLSACLSDKNYQYAIAKHMSVNSDCATLYRDDCFGGLPRARSRNTFIYLECVDFSYNNTTNNIPQTVIIILHKCYTEELCRKNISVTEKLCLLVVQWDSLSQSFFLSIYSFIYFPS